MALCEGIGMSHWPEAEQDIVHSIPLETAGLNPKDYFYWPSQAKILLALPKFSPALSTNQTTNK